MFVDDVDEAIVYDSVEARRAPSVPLKPGGEHIAVTEANKDEYV